MTDFIEISDQDDNLLFINVAHIVFFKKQHLNDTIVLTIKDEKGAHIEIKSKENYRDLTAKILYY